jgi:Peptidase A4 family
VQPVLAAAAALILVSIPVKSATAVHGGAKSRVSRHWAGYVVRSAGHSFTQVRGAWVEPRVVCNRPRSSSAFWIGLGGASIDSRALEQIGTAADCSDRLMPSHSAWYELFPAPPVELPLAIRPGDTVAAEVGIRATSVTLTLRNVSTGTSFSTEESMAAPETDSAEWIVEAPSGCLILDCEPLFLADFGRVQFSGASAITGVHEGSIADPAWTAEQLDLAASTPGTRSAVSTVLSSDGTSFGVTCPRRRIKPRVVPASRHRATSGHHAFAKPLVDLF